MIRFYHCEKCNLNFSIIITGDERNECPRCSSKKIVLERTNERNPHKSPKGKTMGINLQDLYER